jgi:hypothetical protein
MFICFCYGFPLKEMRANNRFCEDSRGVIRFQWDREICSRGIMETLRSDLVVSLKTLNPRSHWDFRIFHTDFQVGSHGLIATAGINPTVSLKPQKPIPRSVWDRGIRTLQKVISNISASTKPYAKRLQPVNQGKREDCLMKTRGQKSRDTVPLNWQIILKVKKSDL